MIKKIIKRIIISILLALMLTGVNCFAFTITKEEIINKDNTEYIKRTYNIPELEEKEFLLSLEKQFKIDKKTFELEKTDRSGGSIIDTIDINTSKTIITDTSNIDEILNILNPEIEYSEGGFTGTYKLDTNSIEIEKKYNGYKEYLVEDTKTYIDLDTNDLDNIPKHIMKDGLVLDLITTNWEITDTRKLQDNTIPSKYKATCYYATKKKIDNPLTYIVKADYIGTADKVTENDLIYEVMYKCISKDKNIYPILYLTGGTTLIVFLIFIGRRKNVVIYNYENGEWKLIGKQSIKKSKIKLDRYNYNIRTNRFKIVLDENIVEKFNGKMIRIVRQKRTIDRLINKENNITPYTIDVVI